MKLEWGGSEGGDPMGPVVPNGDFQEPSIFGHLFSYC